MCCIALAVACLTVVGHGRRTQHFSKPWRKHRLDDSLGSSQSFDDSLQSSGRASSKSIVHNSSDFRASVLLPRNAASAFNPSHPPVWSLRANSIFSKTPAMVSDRQSGFSQLAQVQDRRDPRAAATSMNAGVQEMFPGRFEEDDPTTPRDPDPMDLALDLLEWQKISDTVASLAQTETGIRLLEAGLPVRHSREESEMLQAEMEEAYLLEEVKGNAINLNGFMNMTLILNVARRGGILQAPLLVAVSRCIKIATKARNVIEHQSNKAKSTEIPLTILSGHFDGVPLFKDIQTEIDFCIDENDEINSFADHRLLEVRNKLEDVKAEAGEAIRNLIKNKNKALASNNPDIREDRFVLLVKANYKHMVPGVVRGISGSGNSFYIEPKELSRLNDRLRQLANREAQIEKEVLKKLSGLIGTIPAAEGLTLLHDRITKLDLALARARYSNKLRGAPVKFVDALDSGKQLELPKMRHPLLVWPGGSSSNINQNNMVPLQFEMPAGVRSVVITGPNTGGKTMVLKTLGLAAFMAKAGLRVLCEAPEKSVDENVEVPFFDTVMADIGDDQSIAQSLSTFSAHIARVRRILDYTVQYPEHTSLVLLDEVGTGTDPDEGAALGMAVLRKLAKEKTITLSTTHHGRLKTLKYIDDDGLFENACVEFDVESLAPTYRVLWGIPGMSNALSIADRLGLQDTVVHDARQLMEAEGGQDGIDLADVIKDLQEQSKEQEEENQRLRKLVAETNQKKQTLKKNIDNVVIQEKRLLQDAQKALNSELDAVRDTITKMHERASKLSGVAKEAALLEARNAQEDLKKVEAATKKSRINKGSMSKSVLTGKAKKNGRVTYEKVQTKKKEIMVGSKVMVPWISTQPLEVVKVMSRGKKIEVINNEFFEFVVKATDVAKVMG